MREHVVSEVTFVPRTNDGPLTCSCGDQMRASEFRDHRNRAGLVSSATHRALPSEADMPSAWKPKPIRDCSFAGCWRSGAASMGGRVLCNGHISQYRRGQPLSVLGPPRGRNAYGSRGVRA